MNFRALWLTEYQTSNTNMAAVGTLVFFSRHSEFETQCSLAYLCIGQIFIVNTLEIMCIVFLPVLSF